MIAIYRLKILLLLAKRNVTRNLRRSMVTLLAVLAGVGSSIILAALARGMGQQLISDAIYNLTGHIQIHAPGYLDDPVVDNRMREPTGLLLDTLNSPEVQNWAARVRVPAVIMSERESFGITLVGIDPKQEQDLSFAGDEVAAGTGISSVDDKGLVVGKKLLEQLRTQQGKRVVIMTQDANAQVADKGCRIKGVFDAKLESTEKAYVFTGIKNVQKLLKIEDEISEISLLAVDDKKLSELKSKLKTNAPKLEVKDWRELEALIDAMTEMQDGILALWFGIVMICVGFGVVNTIFMSIYERTREFGIMQAIGMSPLGIIFQIAIESAYLLFIGAVLGTLSGFIGIYLLEGGIDISYFAKGAEVFGLSSIIYPVYYYQDIALINIMILVIGVLGSLYPAWHGARKLPAEAISRV